MRDLDCFLLTRQWRDGPAGLEIELWAASGAGPVRVRVTGERAVCFVERGRALPEPAEALAVERRVALDLATLRGARPVDGLYFRRQRDLAEARRRLRGRGVATWEGDLKPADRYLMERFVTAAFTARGECAERPGYLEMRDPRLRRAGFRPRLRAVSLDIETGGLEGPLYSIAVSGDGGERVFLVGAPDGVLDDGVPVEGCADERALLGAFLDWIAVADPDLLIGWNVTAFDLAVIERRAKALEVPFTLGRGGERAAVLSPRSSASVHVARVPGRVVLDGIEVLRAAFWSFESYELETVAQALLGRGKRIHAEADRLAEVRRLFAEDKPALAAYNLEDCRLVAGIFERAALVPFAMRRAELTGLAMDRTGGSVAAFDHLYLPRLHRRGRVAPDVGDSPEGPASPGGYVLDSEPGLYENVLLLDFKSLYPSIIRTFRIDPLGLEAPGEDPVPGYGGATFAREGAILPGIIEELWAVREEAKRAGDAALSQAVKILMNSFYGVLGTRGCRFHDARLATSITRRGHDIIRASRDWIQARGHRVIYGDTDSLFVLLGAGPGEAEARATGAALAGGLNRWWRERIERDLRLESHLEIEFETWFARFLMPTVRGERTGSKKRYAGLVLREGGEPELVFKGLETVRTDWTPLARRFQRELYRRVFLGEPYEAWLRETVADLHAGRLDAELVYRKRLLRPVEEYRHNVPPHVQAARKLGRPVRWIRYVVTPAGPEPVTDDRELPRPDHEHYRERQLAPVADGILHFLGTSFEAVTGAQMEIF